MRKWMQDKLKRRKKSEQAASSQPVPLQPAYFEAGQQPDTKAPERAEEAFQPPAEAAPETLVNYGFSEAFKKPFDVALLTERIQTLVEERRANA